MRVSLPLIAFAFATCVPISPSALGQATYRVEFDAIWSSSTHPDAYPVGAHFSPLVGATHDSSFVLWERGGIASDGIEQMAETGGTSLLRAEMATMLGNDHLFIGEGVNSPGLTSFEFDISSDSSLVSLVTMVAPSPDWFVGVSGLNLLYEGSWLESSTVSTIAFDAGTDSGSDFTSSNLDTSPREVIGPVNHALTMQDVPQIATFTFTLLSVPEPSGLAIGVMGASFLVLQWRTRHTPTK